MTMFDMLAKGGFIVIILGVCSFITIGIAIERFLFFFRMRPSEANSLRNDIVKGFAMQNVPDAISACEAYDHSLSRIIKSALVAYNEGKNRVEIEEVAARWIELETLNMEKNVGILGTIGNISPYIGLFGTVVGVMKAFRDLGVSGASGTGVVMQGISEALIATACGLIVAVMSVVFYNYFLRKIKKELKQIEIFSEEILGMLFKMSK